MNSMLAAPLVLTALAASPAALPRLSFDASLLGTKGTARVVEARKREDHADFFAPRHLAVTFAQPSNGARALEVYPVAGLLAQYPDPRDGVKGQIDALKKLVAKPTVAPSVPGALPFLPLAFARQHFHASARRVDFSGGRGVRYLAAFSQEIAPVSPDMVLYVFQGLSSDGRHYVSFVSPVSLPALPNVFGPAEVSGVKRALEAAGFSESSAAWNAYLARARRALSTPDVEARLAKLDAFARSIRLR